MTSSRNEEWQYLLDYSHSMLGKAQAGEWEELSSMAIERQSQFEAFFARSVPVEMVDDVAAGIHHIEEIDTAISQLAKEAKKAFSGDASLLKKRKQATQAYSDPGHQER